jgi:hypothetical protein
MLVTADNWESVRRKLLTVGIGHDERAPGGTLLAILTKDGSRFEFTEETFHSLKTAGLLRLGMRADSIRFYWTRDGGKDQERQKLTGHWHQLRGLVNFRAALLEFNQ